MGENNEMYNDAACRVPLLNVLAEVASARLKTDPLISKRGAGKRTAGALIQARKNVKKVEALTLDQIRVLSDKMLLEMFSELTCDEIRRHFSYTCYLVPEKCSQVFNSFGSENKARMQMKAHLLTHIAELLAEANAPGKAHRAKFTAEPLQARRRRLQEGDPKRRKRGRAKAQPRRGALNTSRKGTSEKSVENNATPEKRKYTSIKSRKRNSSTAASATSENNVHVALDRTNNNIKTENDIAVFPKKRSPTVHMKASPNKNAVAVRSAVKRGRTAKGNKLGNKECNPKKAKPMRLNSAKSVNKPPTESKATSADVSSGSEEAEKDHEVQEADAVARMKQEEDEEEGPPAKKIKIEESSQEAHDDDISIKYENGVQQNSKPSNQAIFDGNKCSSSSERLSLPGTQLPMLAQVACHSESYRFYAPKHPLHDHCYTTPSGKKELLHDKVPLRGDDEPPKSSNVAINFAATSNESIFRFTVCTPCYPQVFVPVLPNASQVIEISEEGNITFFQARKTGYNSGISVKRENKSSSDDLRLPKRTKIRTINKLIIPEEMESDSEEGNLHLPDDLTSFHVTNGTDGPNPSDTSDLDLASKDSECSRGSPGWERKLALRCIRALRSKKKEDRGPLKCKICKDKTFTAQATLMYHYRSHAGIKPFTCSICGATFTRQHSLNYHMLIHNNKSRFVCNDCGRNFRHPSHFKEHLRRHTGETPYECGDCGFRFKTRNTYKRHLKTRHGKILTAQGIRQLSNEEFCKVRTNPRKKIVKESPPSSKKKDQETQWPDSERQEALNSASDQS